MGSVHDGVVDEVAVLVERGPDGQLLAVDGGARVGGALGRQRRRSAVGWTPRPSTRAGHLDAGVGRRGWRSVAPPVVHHVGDDPGRLAGRRSR